MALELLDAGRIRGGVRAAQLRHLEVLAEVDSTNSRLLQAEPPPRGAADVVLAEVQHAGRGRRGRTWQSVPGTSLALSANWLMVDAAHAPSSLSLAAGVAVVGALDRLGARGIGVKWPNDLTFNGGKLGGILIEARAAGAGASLVVIGIGINVNVDAQRLAAIEALGVRAVNLTDACAAVPSRNQLASLIIDELLAMLARFERMGFAAFRDVWSRLDVLRDAPVQVEVGEERVAGIARGVDADGALRLETDAGLRKFVSGDASLRRSVAA